MKLRNKKTGEILNYNPTLERWNGASKEIKHYASLADLNEEWEDYEEPKELYWIKYDGTISHAEEGTMSFKNQKLIGNYFETKEEAEKTVEKLKAWQRLEKAGFRFIGETCEYKSDKHFGSVFYETSGDVSDIYEDASEFYDDLDLLLGGEE